ncbi:MAG: GWxTD domain-containing protein [Candidatus Aminicenantes bacterium]
MMRWRAFVPALILVLSIPAHSPGKDRAELADRYKEWLEEEVTYIITPKERDVFLKLNTDKERNIFIQAFWKQRDPTPGTPRNEYKEEHYRRLAYANEFFGRGTPRPGWKTDQGRIYIVLGPPISMEYYENVMNVHPVQVWSYLGDPQYGLPPAFNLVFFKKEGTGEYILYSPSDHGPRSLIADYMGNARNVQDAYQQLLQLEPNLAKHTLSLIPGERSVPGLVSLTASTLFSAVFSYPQKKVKDTYAEAILKYKDIVEVEYTANYIDSDTMVRVMKDDSGFYLVHYSVEPKKLSVDLYEGRYSAYFELNGRVSDQQERTIFQFTKEIPISFDRDQIQDMEAKSFALQDMFPLLPGRYNFDLLVKNKVSKEFTSFEKEIHIPQQTEEPQMGSLILGYGVKKNASGSEEIVPFRVGEDQILCQPREIFSPQESVFVFCQILGLDPETRSQGLIRYAVFKEEQEIFTQTRKIGEFHSDTNFLQQIVLASFSPGLYRLEVSVLNKDGQELIRTGEMFEISHAADLSRPMVISKVMPSSRLEEYSYSLGVQALNKGNMEQGRNFLREAYHKNPNQLKYAVGYSQILFMDRQYQKVKDILLPFLDEQIQSEEVLYFLGKSSHSLGQLDEAIAYYEKYLSQFGTNLEILNLLGTCHYKQGNKDQALQIWQRSLEVNPNQEKIRQLVDSLRKKKE